MNQPVVVFGDQGALARLKARFAAMRAKMRESQSKARSVRGDLRLVAAGPQRAPSAVANRVLILGRRLVASPSKAAAAFNYRTSMAVLSARLTSPPVVSSRLAIDRGRDSRKLPDHPNIKSSLVRSTVEYGAKGTATRTISVNDLTEAHVVVRSAENVLISVTRVTIHMPRKRKSALRNHAKQLHDMVVVATILQDSTSDDRFRRAVTRGDRELRGLLSVVSHLDT